MSLYRESLRRLSRVVKESVIIMRVVKGVIILRVVKGVVILRDFKASVVILSVIRPSVVAP